MYVGSLLMEEVALAGGSKSTNLNYYLINHFARSYYEVEKNYSGYNSGINWLTFTPSSFRNEKNSIYIISKSGALTEHYAFYNHNLIVSLNAPINYRPAINLIKNIRISSGNGTRMNPYEIDFS